MTFKYFKREYELSRLIGEPFGEDIQSILDLFEHSFHRTSLNTPDTYYSKENLPTLTMGVVESYVIRLVYVAMKHKIGDNKMAIYDCIQIIHYLFLELKNVDLGKLGLVTRIE